MDAAPLRGGEELHSPPHVKASSIKAKRINFDLDEWAEPRPGSAADGDGDATLSYPPDSALPLPPPLPLPKSVSGSGHKLSLLSPEGIFKQVRRAGGMRPPDLARLARAAARLREPGYSLRMHAEI